MLCILFRTGWLKPAGLFLLAACCGIASSEGRAAEPTPLPNIVLILADDK
ncbi:hypothetical protein [Lignipirellula cremea]|uniref:Sulfatase n=1 Tax=Lignipirellula cremea TaxID=2528010 RepID=A0A518DRR5_9BACT|nr:hypothetical protein [Lignipirellula cremea]QDU94537.1 hypothetical protein Pla8534_23280 [Lignipirellula cremea]